MDCTPAAESHQGQDVTAPDRNVTVLLPKDGPIVTAGWQAWIRRFCFINPWFGKMHRPAACISSVTFARFGVQYLKKTTMITECMCGSVPGVAELHGIAQNKYININRVHDELGSGWPISFEMFEPSPLHDVQLQSPRALAAMLTASTAAATVTRAAWRY